MGEQHSEGTDALKAILEQELRAAWYDTCVENMLEPVCGQRKKFTMKVSEDFAEPIKTIDTSSLILFSGKTL